MLPSRVPAGSGRDAWRLLNSCIPSFCRRQTVEPHRPAAGAGAARPHRRSVLRAVRRARRGRGEPTMKTLRFVVAVRVAGEPRAARRPAGQSPARHDPARQLGLGPGPQADGVGLAGADRRARAPAGARHHRRRNDHHPAHAPEQSPGGCPHAARPDRGRRFVQRLRASRSSLRRTRRRCTCSRRSPRCTATSSPSRASCCSAGGTAAGRTSSRRIRYAAFRTSRGEAVHVGQRRRRGGVVQAKWLPAGAPRGSRRGRPCAPTGTPAALTLRATVTPIE